jgi:choline dehydrogenase
MGAEGDGVLDEELRVRGVDGLRVIDASSQPKIVAANTNAATIMLAERGSDLILGKSPLVAAKVAAEREPAGQPG